MLTRFPLDISTVFFCCLIVIAFSFRVHDDVSYQHHTSKCLWRVERTAAADGGEHFRMYSVKHGGVLFAGDGMVTESK